MAETIFGPEIRAGQTWRDERGIVTVTAAFPTWAINAVIYERNGATWRLGQRRWDRDFKLVPPFKHPLAAVPSSEAGRG